jgi:LysR family transcriptional regulator, glycine cleavage system transcriptional activator
MSPPLASLRAFEAVARHLSVTRAAEELGVTQPAVTQRLRELERQIGVRLVRRDGRGLALTPEGQDYAATLTRAFAQIQRGTARVLAARRGGRLTIALLPTLATRWLIPRLAGFQARHPEIEVRLATQPSPVAEPSADVDLAIRFGAGRWPGFTADFLMPDDSFPALSPALMRQRPLARPTDLARHTLLQVASEPRVGDWPRWLAAAGCAGLEPAGRLSFPSSAQAIEAALAGLGVGLAHRPFVADDLASGRLLAPLKQTVAGDGGYWLAARREDAGLHRVRAFRDWLLEQVGNGVGVVAQHGKLVRRGGKQAVGIAAHKVAQRQHP